MDFFIIENGQQAGPFTIAQLAEKHITSETLVWREGMADWQPAWKVQELRYILEENRMGANGQTSAEGTNENQQGPAVPPVPPTFQNQGNGFENKSNGGYNPHDGFNQNGEYNQNSGFNQNGAYSQNSVFNQSGEYNQNGGFHQSGEFNQNGEYNQNSAFNQTGAYSQNSEYNPNGAYTQNFQSSPNDGAMNGMQNGAQPQKPKSKLVWKIVAAVIAVLFIMLIASNPSKETHENAIRTEVSHAIDKATTGSSNDIFSQGFRMMARMMAGNVIDSALDQLFEYHNYLLFSKGTITLDGKSHTVSYGVFGKVITMNADDMLKALEKNGLNIEESSSSSSSDDNANLDDSNDEQTTDPAVSNSEDNNNSSSNGDEFEETDDNGDVSANIQKKLEDKTNQAVDKVKAKVKKKVEDKINQKLDEVTPDSTTLEKLIDKILSLF